MLVSLDVLVVYVEAERVSRAKSQADIAVQGSVSLRSRELFAADKP